MFRISTLVAVAVAAGLLATTAADANAQCYGRPAHGFGTSQIRVQQNFYGVPTQRVHVGGGFGAPVHSFNRSFYSRPVYGVNPGIGYGWGHSSRGHSGWGHNSWGNNSWGNSGWGHNSWGNSGWGHSSWGHGGRGISIRF